jgi:hypothetical protein
VRAGIRKSPCHELFSCSSDNTDCLLTRAMAVFDICPQGTILLVGLHVLNDCTHILTVLVTCIEQHAQSQSSNAGLERLQKGSNTLQK